MADTEPMQTFSLNQEIIEVSVYAVVTNTRLRAFGSEYEYAKEILNIPSKKEQTKKVIFNKIIILFEFIMCNLIKCLIFSCNTAPFKSQYGGIHHHVE